MTESEAQVRAEIDRISFRNEENGWTVLRARNCDDNSTITATGHFAQIRPGELYQLIGAWSTHPTYGRQLKIERSLPLRPNTRAAMERYLASGLVKGVGPRTAAKIVEHFGEDTFKILDENPGCITQVKSINKKKAKAIIASWGDQKAIADVMMFLSTHGISPNFAQKIFRLYGAEAIDIVSADPYRLAQDVDGIGFLNADKIARSVGIALNSPQRIRAGILYAIGQAEERGHCFVTTPQLKQMLGELLTLGESDIERLAGASLDGLNASGRVITEHSTDENGDRINVHYTGDLLVAESNVALAIAHLLDQPMDANSDRIERWIERYSEVSGTQFSDAQLAAVRKAASNRVFILTGGPGVGKTTTANAIIRLFKAMGRTVALAAPTGRAAQRLSEVAAEKAKTIHRLLEWVPGLGGFSKNEHNPLAVDVVIIDEASMLDIRLADALVRAVPPTAQFILIGDVDQLPSVGPGNVLRDLIDSGVVPFTRLDQIFRQAASSRIVQAAHAINHGVNPEFSTGDTSDCQFYEVDNGDELKSKLKDFVARILPERYGFNPITDVQILTPMNRGELGTQQLNEELQELLNPKRAGQDVLKRGLTEFRQGDKVIQSSNNYDLGVFNGDIGFVDQASVEGGKLIVSFGDGRVVRYEADQVNELKLAYAITIHKSQGSEFPAVILPISMQHYIMLQRNLVYTGLTRAKKLAILVGSSRALGHAVRTQTSLKRQSLLIERLNRAIQA